MVDTLLVCRNPQYARESLSVGNLPRSPCAPVGAFWPALNGRECASPLPRVGQNIGGTLASPVRYSSAIHNAVYPFSQYATLKPQTAANGLSGAPQFTAHSVEFVAKPEEASQVGVAIPAAIAGALKDVTGFAGCLVMISDQEARLVTVVTLWVGADRTKYCSQNVRWVKALLAPYQDRCLRAQTMIASLPVLPMLQEDSVDNCGRSLGQKPITEDETVCTA